MNESDVWELIESTRTSPEVTVQEHVRFLVTVLAGFSDSDLLELCDAWESLAASGFRYRVWVAFNLVLGGRCNEDRFDDCVNSLMFYGEQSFSKVLQDPDRLSEFGDFQWCEQASLFFDNNWEMRHPGEIMPSSVAGKWDLPDPPENGDYKALFLSDLPSRYPKLCEKYGVPEEL